MQYHTEVSSVDLNYEDPWKPIWMKSFSAISSPDKVIVSSWGLLLVCIVSYLFIKVKSKGKIGTIKMIYIFIFGLRLSVDLKIIHNLMESSL